jgi:hypothetical protein
MHAQACTFPDAGTFTDTECLNLSFGFGAVTLCDRTFSISLAPE